METSKGKICKTKIKETFRSNLYLWLIISTIITLDGRNSRQIQRQKEKKKNRSGKNGDVFNSADILRTTESKITAKFSHEDIKTLLKHRQV